jgi:hypothetical protein
MSGCVLVFRVGACEGRDFAGLREQLRIWGDEFEAQAKRLGTRRRRSVQQSRRSPRRGIEPVLGAAD